MIQGLLGDKEMRDVMGFSQGDDLSDRSPAALFLEIDFVQAAGRRFQDFQEGVDATDFIH